MLFSFEHFASISQFFNAKASCSIPTLPLSSSDSEPDQQSNSEAAAAKQPKLTAVSSSRVSNYAQLISCSSTDTVVAVHLEPYQPRKRFPQITDGEQSRSFQYDWFQKWPWLEWDDDRDCAFCHPCRMAEKLNFVSFSKKAEGVHFLVMVFDRGRLQLALLGNTNLPTLSVFEGQHIHLRRSTHRISKVETSISEGRHIVTSIFESRHIDLRRSKAETSHLQFVIEYCPQLRS